MTAINKFASKPRKQAVDEFIQFHHNPIVADLNKQLAAERDARAIELSEVVAAEREDAQQQLDTCFKHELELEQQLAAERKVVRELAEALRMLRDYQNGCPLPSYEKGWNEAMAMTDAVLPKVEEAK